VMIGLQVVVLPFLSHYWMVGILSILLIVLARWLSIILPLLFLRRSIKLPYSNVAVLTWAGVRGAVSIALALSLPKSPYNELILACSYFIVIFSIVVQGLSLNKLIEYFFERKEEFNNN
jgi:monovalent cation:H+ antiporter, CPA1 family